MIKTLTNVLKQDKEKFAVPRKVQDIIPVRSIWTDGIFMTGKNKYSNCKHTCGYSNDQSNSSTVRSAVLFLYFFIR